jgi:hypothetical protein
MGSSQCAPKQRTLTDSADRHASRTTDTGVEECKALFGDVAKFLDLSRLTVDGLVVDGDHAVALLRVPTAAGNGEVRLAELSIIRDGTVAEMEIVVHDAGGRVG